VLIYYLFAEGNKAKNALIKATAPPTAKGSGIAVIKTATPNTAATPNVIERVDSQSVGYTSSVSDKVKYFYFILIVIVVVSPVVVLSPTGISGV
jgi:hypothetical protein